MRLCSIASGSSGNCIYVGSDTTHLLIDVGISGKRTEAGLKVLDLSMRDIDGIFITHEHTDHIAGLGVLARKYEVPIYATNGTIEAIQNASGIGEIPRELFCPVKAEEKVTIKDLVCNPMRIPMTPQNRWHTGSHTESRSLRWSQIWALTMIIRWNA